MKFKLTEIHTLETKPYEGPVYDLTVENDESYNIDGIVVHNSACSTRIKTGCGVPQLSAIGDCAKCSIPIIADGGCKTPGDVCKAIAAGASMVMLGGMLAGTDETPGDTIWKAKPGTFTRDVIASKALSEQAIKSSTHKPFVTDSGYTYLPYKVFRGMASKEANEDQFGSMADWKTAEGISTLVPAKGPVKNIILDIMGGLRSCMTYNGANNLNELRRGVQFVSITNAGLMESKPHIL